MKSCRIWINIVFLIVLTWTTACNPSRVTSPPVETETFSPTSTEPAETIFYNGNIITVEEDQPLAEAIAIRNGALQVIKQSAQKNNLYRQRQIQSYQPAAISP